MIHTENMCKFKITSYLDLKIFLIQIIQFQILTGDQLKNFEYSKIAPQNIMYDRRVVRGNTFAALVIPVSKPK